MKDRRMSRLRHKKPENLFNKRKDEMNKSKKGKQIKFLCYQCKKKNNKIKSETAEIN